MLELIRNLLRRKLRNGLTIGGIAIGVLALTTMGSLAEKTNFLIDGGVRFFRDHVTVQAASSQFSAGLVPLAKSTEIAQLDGVAAALPTIGILAHSGEGSGFSFGVPDEIIATPSDYARFSTFKLTPARGVGPGSVQKGQVVLGSDFAVELKADVGATVSLPIIGRNAPIGVVAHQFKVIGIMSKTLTAPDNFAWVSMQDGQNLLFASLPPLLQKSQDPSSLATGIDVFGKPGVDLDRLASSINQNVRDVRALAPTDLINNFKTGSLVFTAITTGSAILALVIGGLSVVNTMIVSVAERIREIGLKKAVGAQQHHILVEYLLEATVIGLVGGLIGLGLGWGVTTFINAQTASSHLELFLLSTRLVIGSVIFSVLLGALAGLIPAFRAARLDPVTALRYQ